MFLQNEIRKTLNDLGLKFNEVSSFDDFINSKCKNKHSKNKKHKRIIIIIYIIEYDH